MESELEKEVNDVDCSTDLADALSATQHRLQQLAQRGLEAHETSSRISQRKQQRRDDQYILLQAKLPAAIQAATDRLRARGWPCSMIERLPVSENGELSWKRRAVWPIGSHVLMDANGELYRTFLGNYKEPCKADTATEPWTLGDLEMFHQELTVLGR